MADKINRKPSTPEELKADIENHPDRGKLGGAPAVRFEPDEVRGRIPKEMHRKFILACASMGLTKTDGLQYAIARFVSDPGTQAMIQAHIKMKSETYGVPESEVINQIFGAYKDIARRKRARIEGVEIDLDDDRLDEVIDDAQPVDSMDLETPDYGFADDGRSTKRGKGTK